MRYRPLPKCDTDDIDNNDISFVDLNIDTAQYTPDQIAEIILEKAAGKGLLEKL